MSIRLHSRYRARRILLGISGGLVISVLSFVGMVGTFSQMANAFTSHDRIGPNPDWYNNSARFVLENDANVSGSQKMIIPVFIQNTGSVETAEQFPPTDVTIRGFDFAKGYVGGSASSVRFTYKSQYSDTTHSCKTLTTSYAGVGSSDRNFTIDRECFTYREDINAWYFKITANLRNSSGIIHFRTQITSPTDGNESFGYDSTTSKFAIGARYRCDFGGSTSGCNSYYNYAIPFGTPCSVTANKKVSAYIYDADNPSGSAPYGIQPKTFNMRISDVTDPSNIVSTPVSISGSGGNGKYYKITFTVQPSHKYLFKINHVYTNNVLQFSLPYDSIEYIANCAWGLTPNVSLDVDQVEPPTNGISVNYSVTNGGPGGSADAQWQLTKCKVAPSAPSSAYGQVANNTSDGVTTYNALGASCQQAAAGTTTFPKGVKALGPLNNESIADDPVGTRVCYILSVNPPTDLVASNTWKHSKPVCILLVKKPKVQILGNDLIVGKNNLDNADVQTSLSRRDVNGVTKSYGSWVEYAIAASGAVVNAASGAGYAGGNISASFCVVSTLTFSNTPVGGDTCNDLNGGQGNYKIEKSLPDIGSRLTGGTALGVDPTIDIRTIPKGIYTASGTNISITNSLSTDVPKGKWVVIKAPGATVTIKNDIKYTTASLKSAAEIPQIIIIADKINIKGSVNQIDAWLIARGTNGYIDTCSDVAIGAPLTAQTCNNPLLVNGPVVSEKIYLYRTSGSGSGTQASVPAERFNLRPDAYLWATEWMSSAGRLQTVYTKELPPRF